MTIFLLTGMNLKTGCNRHVETGKVTGKVALGAKGKSRFT